MSIIQISKIQHRSGNLVDLPQLDEAELGFASDDKRLFIGKDSPPENIEVLTSYSTIAFNQLDGGLGNLEIDSLTAADGQVLAYDGNNWVNKGGIAGGLITLGDVSNVRIDGGGIGYVLETDGTGTLTWTPKGVMAAYVFNATQANPCLITTTDDCFFTQGSQVTITNVPGMTQLNGNTFYVDVLTSDTFTLYSDSALTVPIDSTGYGAFPYTTASATNSVANLITVTDTSLFTLLQPVVFAGTLGSSNIVSNTTYYVSAIPDATHMSVSETSGGAELGLFTASIAASVYVPGGRVISAIGGGTGAGSAAGSTYSVQYNNGGLLAGGSDLTFNYSSTPKLLSINGDANVSNIGSNGVIRSTRFLSNIATGTAPLEVVSTTRVSNLNVAYSNVSDFVGVTNITASANYYPTFVSASATGNRSMSTSGNFIVNPGLGDIYASNRVSANFLTGTLTTAAQPNITTVGTLGNLTVTSNTTSGNFIGIFANGTSNIRIPVASGNVNLSVGGTSNVLIVTSTGANITGTLNATGNANAGNIGATNGVFTNISGTLTTASQTNITTIGTLGNLTVTSNTTSGNFIGIFANGTSNIRIPAASGNVNTSVGGTSNILIVTSTGVNVAGTLNATGNANVGNLGVSGNILANSGTVYANTFYGNNLTTGANVNTGTITGNWQLSSGSILVSTYGDLAEYYAADDQYNSGTVLQFGGTEEVTLADDETVKVAGVVTTNAAYLMNQNCPGAFPIAIALQGRVPCKVVGEINKGDIVVSAGNGYAKACSEPRLGSVIGKAIQHFSGESGVIEIAIGRL